MSYRWWERSKVMELQIAKADERERERGMKRVTVENVNQSLCNTVLSSCNHVEIEKCSHCNTLKPFSSPISNIIPPPPTLLQISHISFSVLYLQRERERKRERSWLQEHQSVTKPLRGGLNKSFFSPIYSLPICNGRRKQRQPFSTHNATMLNNIADSQIPDLNLEFSLGGIYTENSNQSPLDRSSKEAKVLRLQEPQTAPQMAAAPVRSIRRPRARSLPKEPRLRRPIRPKDVLASRRRETKQKIAQRQMSQQLAALPEVARAVAAPAAPTALAVCSASRASIGAGASDTVYHYKEEGYFTVSRAAEGAISVQTLHSQRDVTPIASSATATTTKQAVPSQSTPENPSKRVKHSSGSVPQNDGDEMVSVRTTGEGGRQIEGILYARNGQVQILCVCHGIYHSPAEFIKHGGGKEVANPLKHIIVRPSSD